VQPLDGHVWFMQPKAQTTTRGILAVSAGDLEALLQYIWRFRSGRTLFELRKTEEGSIVSIDCMGFLLVNADGHWTDWTPSPKIFIMG